MFTPYRENTIFFHPVSLAAAQVLLHLTLASLVQRQEDTWPALGALLSPVDMRGKNLQWAARPQTLARRFSDRLGSTTNRLERKRLARHHVRAAGGLRADSGALLSSAAEGLVSGSARQRTKRAPVSGSRCSPSVVWICSLLQERRSFY